MSSRLFEIGSPYGEPHRPELPLAALFEMTLERVRKGRHVDLLPGWAGATPSISIYRKRLGHGLVGTVVFNTAPNVSAILVARMPRTRLSLVDLITDQTRAFEAAGALAGLQDEAFVHINERWALAVASDPRSAWRALAEAVTEPA